MPDKWKDIFVEYTQDTSMHGVRYTTLPTTSIRRIIWVLVVAGCLTGFIALAIDRLLHMLSKPKAVTVEVSFTEQMEFPAVTICNQNLFRLTSLQQLGLYDLFQEKLSQSNDRSNSTQTAGLCKEDFYRVTDGCLLPEEFWDYKTHVFKEITLGVCRHLCLDVHKDECSLIQYSGKHRICILTQNRALPPQTSCEKVIRMRRTRCPDPGEIYCDFERITKCPFLKETVDGHEMDIGPEWHIEIAGNIFSKVDHTALSPRGHQAGVFTGNNAAPIQMKTPLLNTTGMCLELFYVLAPAIEGQNVGFLTLSTEDEDLRLTEMYKTSASMLQGRAMVILPDGKHRIVITAIGRKSNFAVDDITSIPCDKLDQDVLRHQTGQGYSGTRAVSVSGKTCRPWIDQLGEGITHVPNGGAPIQENYCRNVFMSPDGPGCFTEPVGQYEKCDIPFRQCLSHEFKCDSGQCVSEELKCDLNKDCVDGSDEDAVCAFQRSIDCVFDDLIHCGYVVSDKSSPGHVWSEAEGEIKEFVPPNSQRTRTTTYLRLESFLANIGDRSWLVSPVETFLEISCLEFLLQMLYVESFEGLPSITVYTSKGQHGIQDLDLRPIFYYNKHLDDRWHRAKITIPAGTYRLVFEFTTGGEDAAITDIKFELGSCLGFSHLQSQNTYLEEIETIGTTAGTMMSQGHAGQLKWLSDNYFYTLESEWMSQIITEPKAVRTEDGDLCSLPFLYQGVSYDTCIPDPQAMGKLWCSTTPNYDADKQRKFCFQGHYIRTVNGTGDGKPCKFPFTVNDETFYSCVSEGSYDYYWCEVDDSDNWGQCIVEEDMTYYVPNDGMSWRSGWCLDTYSFQGKNFAGCNKLGELEHLSCGSDPKGVTTGACLESCGGYFRSKEGTLRSPNYLNVGGDYPNEAKCSYWIEQPPGTKIKLEFLKFATEYEEDCDYDYLEIFDGISHFSPTIARLCGDEYLEPIITPRNIVYLLFSSDGSIADDGFIIRYSTVTYPFNEQIGDVLKFTSSVRQLKNPVKFMMHVSTFDDIANVSCVNIVVSAKPSITLELRRPSVDGIGSIVQKSVNFTLVSSELTDREVRWTLQPGSYHLYLVAVRSKAVEVTVDAVVKGINLTAEDCANIVTLGSKISCNFFSDGGCGYLDISPGPAHFILDHHKRGMAMVARIPLGTIGARLGLISQQTTIAKRSSITVLYEFINWDTNSAYNEYVISLRNMANDSYELGKVSVKDEGEEWSWSSCVIVDPGILRLEIIFSSSTPGEFAVDEVFVSKDKCWEENETNGTIAGNSGDIWCDFEDTSQFSCPFRPSIPAAGGKSWIITEAKLTTVEMDHTTGSKTGVYFHLFPTFPVDNDTHSLSTDVWKSTGKCLQFWYRTTDMQHCLISVRAEDPLSESGPRLLYLNNVTAEEWMRVYVELPPGSHKIHIQGVRHSDKSGIVVDDIILRDCKLFTESRLTEKGIEYMGSMNISAGGDACINWDQAGAAGSIPWGGAALAGHNHCRNLLLLDEGPGCFTDMGGTYQMCNISYDACKPGYYRCNSGRCVPPSRECDGEINCLDGSDEHCSHVDAFNGPWKGFNVSPLSAEYITWNKTDLGLKFDSNEANMGDRLWLVGPPQSYASGCLSVKWKMPPNPLYPTLPLLTILTSSTPLDNITSLLAAVPLAESSKFPDDQTHILEVPLSSGTHRIVYQVTMGTSTVIFEGFTYTAGNCAGSATVADDCKTTARGVEYVGVEFATNTGIQCQPWTAKTPQSIPEKLRNLDNFYDKSLSELDNNCRNPDDGDEPWCYTMDPDERFEYCNVPYCTPMAVDRSLCALNTYLDHPRYSCLFTDGYSLWCYTNEDRSAWHYCSQKGRGRHIRTLLSDDSFGEACNLPFEYDQQTYHTCDKLGGSEYKCGLGDPKNAATRFGTCVNDCGGYFTQKTGYIVSPTLYDEPVGSPYPNNAVCVYQIEQPVGHRINFTFISLDLHNSSDTCEDFIEVRDGLDQTGELLYKSCDTSLPNVISSIGNTVWIFFKSLTNNVNHVGFVIKYEGYLYDNSLPPFQTTESFLSAEHKIIGYKNKPNNRWSVRELVNLTVPEAGSCLDIDFTYIGAAEVFYSTGERKHVLLSEMSHTYKHLRQELSLKEQGQYQLFLKTSYIKSVRVGASFILKRFTILEGNCDSGYDVVLGAEGIAGSAYTLLDRTYAVLDDSCLIIPYVFRVMDYFDRMPVYQMRIIDGNDTLAYENFDRFFNRTNRLKGTMQVPLGPGTYNIKVQAKALSRAQVGIGEALFVDGACPEKVSICTKEPSGRGHVGIEDRTTAGQPCVNGTGDGYNTCSNPGYNRKSGLWCYLEKESHTFDMCDVPVCSTVRIDDGSCRLDLVGATYDGPTSKSASGKDCMRWDAFVLSDDPASWYVTDDYFPENNMSKSENFCRNPAGLKQMPWCFTDKDYKEEQDCWIPLCDISPYKACLGDFGEETTYTGQWSKTRTNVECQKWDSNSPHSHSYVPSDFPEDSLLLADNHCRRLDDSRPWCYTTDPEIRWDYCDIPKCPSIYTIDGQMCNFPFIYEGKRYTGCIRTNNDDTRFWCSLTPNFDEIGDWGICKEQTEGSLVIESPQTYATTDYTADSTEETITSSMTVSFIDDREAQSPEPLIRHPDQDMFGGEYLEYLQLLHNISLLYELSGHQLHDTIISCWWNGASCYKYMGSRLTDSGLCISFNHNPDDTITTAKTGATFGLRLTMDTQRYEYMIGPNTDAGIKVYLHDQKDEPMVRNLGFAISTGLHGLVAAKLSVYETLARPWGECMEEQDLQPQFGANYSLSKCNRWCETQYTNEQCGCIDAYMPDQGKYEFCNMTSLMDCLIPLTYESGVLEDCNFECPDQCSKSSYSAELSYSSLSGTSIEKELERGDGQEKDRFLHSQEIRQRVTQESFSSTFSLLTEVTNIYHVLLSGGLEASVQALEQSGEATENLLALINQDVLILLNDTLTQMKSSYKVTLGPLFAYALESLEDVWDFMTMVCVKYQNATVDGILDADDVVHVRELVSLMDMVITNVTNAGTYNRTGDPWKIEGRYPKDVPGGKPCRLIEKRMIKNTQELKVNITGTTGNIFVSELLGINDDLRKDYVDFKNCLNLFRDQLDKMDGLYTHVENSFSMYQVTLTNFLFKVGVLSLGDVKAQLEKVQNTTEHILLAYAMNETTKKELTRILVSDETNIDRVSSFIVNLTAQSFEISDLIENIFVESLTFYEDAILGLTQLEHHLATNIIERRYVREMYIWKRPHLSTEIGLEVKFRDPDETQVWPSSRKTADFMRVRGRAYLSDVADEVKTTLLEFITNARIKVEMPLENLEHKRNEMRKELQQYSDSIDIGEDFILKNFLQMDVFFSQLKYEKVTQLKAYELSNYLSEIGGYMGLLIGASAITLVEVFDLIIYNIFRKVANARKVAPEKGSITTIDVAPSNDKPV